jgi:peptide/nickel transport system substrate-binding protein
MRWRVLSIVLVGIATLVSCTPSPAPSPLRIGLSGAPVGLDPHASADFITTSALANAYEGLVSLDGNLRLRPALAERWENPDETTWRFHLRPGVRFHTGALLTAADVAASFARARERTGDGVAPYLTGVSAVRVVGSDTVDLATSDADPLLLNRLASVAIVPRSSPALIEASCGTGPYRIRRSGPDLLLEAFDDYRGPPPGERVAYLVPTGDRAARRRHAQLGDLDILPDLDRADAQALKQSAAGRVVSRPSAWVTFLQMAVGSAPFSDPRVRRAVDLALDRATLAEDLLHGFGRPASQLVSPGVFGFVPSRATTGRDLVAARRLLREAGYPEGLEVSLEFHEGTSVEALAVQLAAAGIRARPVPRAWDELLQRVDAGSVKLLYSGFVSDSGDASLLFESLLHSRGGPSSLGDLNTSGYSDPEMDRLIEQARRTGDPARRQALLGACQRLAQDALPLVPVLNPDDVYLVRPGILWQPRLDGRVLAAEIERP